MVLAGLLDRVEDAIGPAVCLHGDATVRNAISDGGRVALLDLEHAASGPRRQTSRTCSPGSSPTACSGGSPPPRPARLADALVAGYAAVAPPPGARSLRWHADASLLARVAQPAINRVRPDVLRRLGPLLETAIA